MFKIKTWFASILIVLSLLTPNVLSQSESDGVFYGTFIGGSQNDRIRDIALDSQGNIIIVGGTFSEDFPVQNAVQEIYGGGNLSLSEHWGMTGDAFVAKFSPNNQLLWSTYLGGSSEECANHVAVGPEDEVIVFGLTTSPDFPVTYPSNTSERDTGDPFISMYNPEGGLIGTRLYVPDEIDGIEDVTVDSMGNLVLIGSTSCPNMYTTENAYQRELLGETDGYIRVISPDLEEIIYSSYFGGSGTEYLGDVAVGNDKSIIISGSTESRDLPITDNCIRSEYLDSEYDGFIAKFDRDRNLVLCTYRGGSGIDHVFGLTEGPRESIIFVGRTWSFDYPVSDDALQTEYDGTEVDGFFTIINDLGDTMIYSTYYGRESWDSILNVDKDEDDRLVISGFVCSSGFEMINPFQSEYKGSSEIVILVWDNGFEFISYLGSYYSDHPTSQVLKDGVLYLAGLTRSSQFMTTDNAYQKNHNGGEDGFIWTMNYETYMSGEVDTNQSESGLLTPSLRNYLSYSLVFSIVILGYILMKRLNS